MSQSTARRKPDKPKKPRPDFPLFPHQTGRWAKKVRGRLVYFGKIEGDPYGEAALDLWLAQRDELLAGRRPRPVGDYVSVADLCNRFLTWKKSLRDVGEIAPRTFDRLYATCEYLVEQFGKSRAVEDLGTEDFEQLRSAMAKRWGKVALSNEIGMVRSIFKYGHDAAILDKSVRFGPGFARPNAKVLRVERAAGGIKMFSAKQIRQLLKVSSTNVKAMVLLGINGGLGNTDLGELPIAALDMKGGWLNYPRPKTGIPRRIPLWKETLTAIRAVLKARHEPRAPEAVNLLFIGARGQSYAGDHKGYRVAQEFDQAAREALVSDRTFYDLRRTFQTVAEEVHDLVAVQSIMGHAAPSDDMSSRYRQTVSDERLLRAVECVHTWLFGHNAKGKSTARRAKPR